jgi:hypothetical protein
MSSITAWITAWSGNCRKALDFVRNCKLTEVVEDGRIGSGGLIRERFPIVGINESTNIGLRRTA